MSKNTKRGQFVLDAALRPQLDYVWLIVVNGLLTPVPLLCTFRSMKL